jgi:hypothetical protein
MVRIASGADFNYIRVEEKTKLKSNPSLPLSYILRNHPLNSHAPQTITTSSPSPIHYFLRLLLYVYFLLLLNSTATFCLSKMAINHLSSELPKILWSTQLQQMWNMVKYEPTQLQQMSVRFGAKPDSQKRVSPTDRTDVGRRNLYLLPAAGCRHRLDVGAVTAGGRQAADLHSAT